MQNGILYFKHFLIKLIVNSSILTQMLSTLVSFLSYNDEGNYEKGISWDRQFLRNQGSKFPSLLGSGLKFCLKYLDHSQKHTPRYDPDLNFNLKTCNLTMSGKASFIIRSCQLS